MEQRAFPQRQHLPSQPSCVIILSKDFQEEDDQGQEKAIKESKAGVCGAELPRVQRQHRAGELGKSLRQIRCTRLVFLPGHSSKERKVPG